MNAINWTPVVKILDNLAARWADESQYEEFADYVAVMHAEVKKVAPTAEGICLARKPFKLTFELNGARHEMKVNAKGIAHKVWARPDTVRL